MPESRALGPGQNRGDQAAAAALDISGLLDDFRPIYENTPAMLHSVNDEGRIVGVSNLWLEVLGYRREEVIGRRSSEFLTEESARNAVENVVPGFLASGICNNVPYQFIAKNGEVKDMLLSARAQFSENGGLLRSLAVLVDITEQKRVEQALQASEARYRAILQDQTELICRYGWDTGLVFVNQAFCTYFGRSEEDLLGTAFPELFPEGSRDGILDHISRLKPGQPRTQEQQIPIPNGQDTWQQWTDSAICDSDGEIIEYQSVGRDVTASRRQQIALSRLHEITGDHELSTEAKVHEVIRLGLDHFGLDTGIISQISGNSYLMQEVISSDPDLKPGTTMDLAATYCRFTLDAGQAVAFDRVGQSVLAMEPSYRTLGLEAYVAAPLYVGGELRGTLSFSSLAASRRPFGPDDLEIAGLLAQWLGLLFLTEEKTHKLEQSNKDLEEFAYIASHDLQEPLRTISSFCDLLQQRLDDQLDEQSQEFIDFIQDGAGRMRGLVSALLSYSRVDRTVGDFESIEMAEVLRLAKRNLAAALDDEGITLEQGDLPIVHGDERLLLQLLQNLIGNAIKFRRDKDLRIRIDAEADGNLWRFAVADNGIGFEPRYAERIFQIFQRLHSSDAVEGSGIGLSICKRIVQRHGGQIWAESQPGQGTTFYFTLPKGR